MPKRMTGSHPIEPIPAGIANGRCGAKPAVGVDGSERLTWSRLCVGFRTFCTIRLLTVMPPEAGIQSGGSGSRGCGHARFRGVTREGPASHPSGSYHPHKVLPHPPHRTPVRRPTRTLPANPQSIGNNLAIATFIM